MTDRIKNRWGLAGNLAAAFILPALVWLTVLFLFGIFPFGDKSILITDLSTQYIEYHAALYDMTKTGHSLLFTWNSGMGMNFWGLIAYYLSSPFTLLMFLFPRSMITEAVLFIISMKIAVSGLTFSLFLRRTAGITGPINTAAAVMYSLSAYTVCFCFNLMFLDGVLLLPLVALGAHILLKKKKILPFLLSLTLLFISNYYMAYMVGIFVFLLFLTWLYTAREDKKQTLYHLGRFFLATVAAAGLSAFLLLPAFFSLTGGYERLHGLNLSFSLVTDPTVLPGKLGFGAYDSVTNSGSPNLFCGMLALGLLPGWFFHRKIDRREKIATGVLFLFLLLSLCLYSLDVAWHVFQPPTWFPARYSFVVIFLIVTCAARTLSHPEGISLPGMFCGFIGVLLVMALALIGGAPFAASWIPTFAFLLGYMVLALLLVWIRNRHLHRLLALVITAVVCVEMGGSALLSLRGLDKELHFLDRQDYVDYSQRNGELMASLASLGDTDFFRVENSAARDSNDGLAAGYPAVSHYSSVSNQRTFRFMGDLGMIAYVNHRYLRYYGATSALDALMGVKYVFDSNDIRYGMDKTEAPMVGKIALFENRNALPLAYFADSQALTLEVVEDRPFEMQNRLFSALGGQTSAYYTPLAVTPSVTRGTMSEEGDRTFLSGVNYLTLHIENPKTQHVLLYLTNNFYENATVLVNGKMLNAFNDRLVRGVIDLGEQMPGTVEVRIQVSKSTAWFDAPQAVAFDSAAFDALISKLRQNLPSSLEVTDFSVRMEITAPQDGIVFTSIPADAGWSIRLDGKKVEAETVAGAFLAIPVDEGAHSLSFSFLPKGFLPGCILSCLTPLLLIAGGVWFSRRKRRGFATDDPPSDPI